MSNNHSVSACGLCLDELRYIEELSAAHSAAEKYASFVEGTLLFQIGLVLPGAAIAYDHEVECPTTYVFQSKADYLNDNVPLLFFAPFLSVLPSPEEDEQDPHLHTYAYELLTHLLVSQHREQIPAHVLSCKTGDFFLVPLPAPSFFGLAHSGCAWRLEGTL